MNSKEFLVWGSVALVVLVVVSSYVAYKEYKDLQAGYVPASGTTPASFNAPAGFTKLAAGGSLVYTATDVLLWVLIIVFIVRLMTKSK